jgi:hypothetical protein
MTARKPVRIAGGVIEAMADKIYKNLNAASSKPWSPNWGLAQERALNGQPKRFLKMLQAYDIPIDDNCREFLVYIVASAIRGTNVLRQRRGRSTVLDDFDLPIIRRYIKAVRESSTRLVLGEQMKWLAHRYNVSAKTLYRRLKK